MGSLQALREAGKDERTVYQTAVRVGQQVQEVVERWRERYGPAIIKRLGTHSLDSRLNDPIGVQMLLNSAFLVRREHRAGFEAELDRLGTEFEGRLVFRNVAPVPPYNFVHLRLAPPGREET